MTRAALLAALLIASGCESTPPPSDDAFTEVDTVAAVPAEAMELEPMTGGTTYRGELSEGDSTLVSGEFADDVRFAARRGQQIVVDLTSDEDLDTYLILRSPAGDQHENDDADGPSHSRVEVVADTSGMWRVIATSYEAGQTGPYTLRIRVE